MIFRNNRVTVIVGFIIFLIWVAIFKPVLFDGKTLFPGNLLVSFYQPWASEVKPGWEHGVPNKPNGIDNLRLYEPYRSVIRAAFAEGQLPLWNPYSFSGNYLLGQSEGGVFYPLFLLLSWLPVAAAWNIALIIEPLLVGLGMWLYLRLVVKNMWAAMYGAWVFAFSGVVIVRMFEALTIGHTLLWLPYVLYGLEGWIQKRKVGYLVVMELAMVFSVLSGWFQFTFYIVLFSGIYGVWAGRNIPRRVNLGWMWVYICLPVITCLQLYPAVQTLTDSVRGARMENVLLDLHLMPIQHLLTLVFPDLWGNPGAYNFFGKSEYKEAILYIGTVPFVVSLFAFLAHKSNQLIKFFITVTIVTIFLGLDTPISRWLWSLPIPIVSSFLPNRIFFLSAFGLSVLSAYGLEYVINNRKNMQLPVMGKVLWIPGLMVIWVGVFVAQTFMYRFWITKIEYKDLGEKIYAWLVAAGRILRPDNLTTISRNSVIPIVLLIIFIMVLVMGKRMKLWVFGLCIIILTGFGQWYFAQKYLFFSEKEFGFVDHPVFTYLQTKSGIDRFMTIGEGYVFSNIPAEYKLYSADGLAAMYPLRYAQLVGYMQNKGGTGDAPRVEVRLAPEENTIFNESDPYLFRFMEITGIKYVVKLKEEKLNKNEQFLTNMGTTTFPLIWENDKWQIFEYKKVWPRFLWTNEFKIEPDNQKLLAELFEQNNLSRLIYLEEDPGIVTFGGRGDGTVSLLSYKPHEVVLKVVADTDGLVYLSDNNTKLFRATVDEIPVKILNANWAFRAVKVPAGEYIVRMGYDLRPTMISLMVSVGGIVVFGISLYVISKQKLNYEKI